MAEQNGSQPTVVAPVLSWREARAELVFWSRVEHLEGQPPDVVVATLDELDRMFARYIVSIPADWLIPEAPANLDWSDPQSFGWVSENKIKSLIRAVRLAQTPEEISKNSEAH
jgi:hypothetical protein